jgi:soluble lytic murein transglycosylase-like protein
MQAALCKAETCCKRNWFFAAQIHQKSRWRTHARSPYASGLARFTEDAARGIAGVYPDKLGGPQPLNPAWALRALVTYDRHLWNRVSGATECERWACVVSGYNGGPGCGPRDQRLAKQRGADPERWFANVEKYSAGRAGLRSVTQTASSHRQRARHCSVLKQRREARNVVCGWNRALWQRGSRVQRKGKHYDLD